MKIKTGTIIFLIVTIFASLTTCGIYAYLTASDTQINIMTIGDNNTEIVEAFETPDKINPGDNIKKEVSVKNNGSMPCYVRVALMVSNKNMQENITLEINKTDWVQGADGYYYYTKPLPVNQTTSNLLTSVKISSSINQEDIENFNITVYSESVQQGNNNEYTNAWKIFLN